MTSLRLIQAPDCRTYPCKEECCSWGVDVEPEERQRMIEDGIATEADFTGPQLYEGEPLYRTALSGRGCVFLCRRASAVFTRSVTNRACALPFRAIPKKWPSMLEDDQMPCHREWKWE